MLAQPERPSFMQPIAVDHTIAPTHQISFPGSDFIFDADFSPDDQTVYCLIDGQSVDLWAAGLYRWPEILGAVLVLCVLLYFALCLRLKRRPQTLGTPYCRRCNYDLSAQSQDSACPECGVSLADHRPRPGRSLRRRLRWPTIVMTALALSYASLYFFIPARGQKLSGPDLWSSAVDDLVERHQPKWLLAHRVPVNRIVAVDTASGQITRTVRTLRGYSLAGLRVSPNGRYLLAAEQDHRLLWINARNGRIAASTRAGEFRVGDHDFLVGFDGPAHDPWVYFASADQQSSMSLLTRWNPLSGKQVTVIQEPAFIITHTNGSTSAVSRRYGLLRRGTGVAILSAPSFSQSHQEGKYTITGRASEAVGGAVEFELNASFPFISMSPLFVAPKSEKVYLVSSSAGIVGFKLADKSPFTLEPGRRMASFSDMAAMSADESRFFLAAHEFRSNAILVRDLVNGTWPARLTIPAPFIAPHLTASPGNRWLAAMPFQNTPAGAARSQFKHELFLYDLAPINPTGR